ncbi:hypothetical protein AKJ41_02805 [candidate division MSBL1 archaeon SCGC-AAA259O05]|uniref:Bacterial type II secretion system protein E domain-containing protein n=1 Tax=candidate division MSBL1 archaeon SCGC-AAA259O05 TaxID=1698271 RepID=A0A133V3Q2_9EURY|nr:hypothetical protein AKJ41_02805 [candidate division MSBL1 archaeon SCGC-AAA259O05]
MITEVRSLDSVKSALGAAARRGSQPVLSTFHARTKRQMFDLVCNIMGLHKAAYKYMDLIISTAKFNTSEGTIRRVTEISEILKEWEEEPDYARLFVDDRENDILKPANLFEGPKKWKARVNSYDLSDVDPFKAAEKLDFLPPGDGGSSYIPRTCERLAIDLDEFMIRILAEAKMKSEMLMLARKTDDIGYLELPFVSESYDKYFSEFKRHAPDYKKVLSEWRNWLEEVK